MPFSVSAPTDLEDVLASLADFYQNTMSWTVAYTPGNLEVTIPGHTQTFTFTYETVIGDSSSAYGVMEYEQINCVLGNIADPMTARWNYLTPLSRLFVHAGTTPEPWSLVTIESAPGYFHHLFFGFVEKIGAYDGGAVVSATYWPTYHTGHTAFNRWTRSPTDQSYQTYNLLFTGSFRYDIGGGLEIESPEAPVSSYRFHDPDSSAMGYSVGGGFIDAYNGLLSWAEFSGVDGSVNAHPIILFAMINADGWQTPVACVPGVRMINTSDFGPAEVISMGGETWQVFPSCNKWLAYAEVPGKHVGPGRFTDSGSSSSYYNMGGATERWGIAVKRE